MVDITSRLLRKLGFERLDLGVVHEADLLSVVRVGADGQTQVPPGSVLASAKFKRQVSLLGEIADAHRGWASER